MNHYAAIDTTDTVTAVYTSEHDAGHPDVRAWGETVGRWVYCEEPCQVGDVLDVDNDGCATVRETGDEVASVTYTYTIYDGDPASSGLCAWPSHEDVEIEADSPEEALAEALSEAESEGESCGEYTHGATLYVLVWDADSQVVADGSVEIKADPPSSPIGDVEWEYGAAADYVACVYGRDGDEPGDCYTRVGEDEAGWWWVDDGDDTERVDERGPYADRDEAVTAAEALAEEQDESDVAEERTEAAAQRRAEEDADEEARHAAELEAERLDRIGDIPGADDPVWIAVDMDGRQVHGPGTYAEVDAAVEQGQRAFRATLPSGSGAYLPRSIVRSDRPYRREWQHSTRYVQS